METGVRGHQVQDQDKVVIRYKQFSREETLRFDLWVNPCLFVESMPSKKCIPHPKLNCSAT